VSDDRHQTGGPGGEVDWGTLIRSELEAHTPRGLPAQFTPRSQPAPRRRLWRPLALAVAALLAAGGFVTVQAHGGVVRTWQDLTSNFAPVGSPEPTGPLPSASPSASGQGSPVPSRGSSPPPSSPGPSAPPSAPGAQPSAGATTAPSGLPLPTPSRLPLPSVSPPLPSLPIKSP
jgi:hypothetical protein